MELSLEKTILVTADGIPLKTSLARAQRRSKFVAFMMVFPLLFFIMIGFIVPIVDMLFLSVDNSIVIRILPKTVESLKNWDPYLYFFQWKINNSNKNLIIYEKIK